MFSTAVIVIALVISVLALGVAVQMRQYCIVCKQFIEEQNENSQSLKRIAVIEGELLLQTDAIDSIAMQLKRLRGRIQARKLNSDRKEPDPKSDLDDQAWKRAANAKLLGDQHGN